MDGPALAVGPFLLVNLRSKCCKNTSPTAIPAMKKATLMRFVERFCEIN